MVPCEYNDESWTKLSFIVVQGIIDVDKELQQNELLLLEKAHELVSDKYV